MYVNSYQTFSEDDEPLTFFEVAKKCITDELITRIKDTQKKLKLEHLRQLKYKRSIQQIRKRKSVRRWVEKVEDYHREKMQLKYGLGANGAYLSNCNTDPLLNVGVDSNKLDCANTITTIEEGANENSDLSDKIQKRKLQTDINLKNLKQFETSMDNRVPASIIEDAQKITSSTNQTNSFACMGTVQPKKHTVTKRKFRQNGPKMKRSVKVEELENIPPLEHNMAVILADSSTDIAEYANKLYYDHSDMSIMSHYATAPMQSTSKRKKITLKCNVNSASTLKQIDQRNKLGSPFVVHNREQQNHTIKEPSSICTYGTMDIWHLNKENQSKRNVETPGSLGQRSESVISLIADSIPSQQSLPSEAVDNPTELKDNEQFNNELNTEVDSKTSESDFGASVVVLTSYLDIENVQKPFKCKREKKAFEDYKSTIEDSNTADTKSFDLNNNGSKDNETVEKEIVIKYDEDDSVTSLEISEIGEKENVLSSASTVSNKSVEKDILVAMEESKNENEMSVEMSKQLMRDIGPSVAALCIESKLSTSTNSGQEIELVTSDSQDSISRNAKLSTGSCNVGDFVFIHWDLSHDCYRIMQQNSSTLYFLHSDCIQSLGLKRLSGDETTRMITCTGIVLEKQYCVARKAKNRYNVPKGTQFYHVKVSAQPEITKNQSISSSISRLSFDKNNCQSVLSTSTVEQISESSKSIVALKKSRSNYKKYFNKFSEIENKKRCELRENYALESKHPNSLTEVGQETTSNNINSNNNVSIVKNIKSCVICSNYENLLKEHNVLVKNDMLGTGDNRNRCKLNAVQQQFRNKNINNINGRKKYLTRSQQQLLKQGKVTIDSCNSGDCVFIYWDGKYDSYRILLRDKNYLHFLHIDCLETLGLRKLSSNSRTKLIICCAEVVKREFCVAKKVTNRYNVVRGTKFYHVRVKAKQILPSNSTVSQFSSCKNIINALNEVNCLNQEINVKSLHECKT